MNQNKVEGQSGAVESDQEESCSESTESNSMDTNMLRSKFASLAATLQQTNQNLVTFEYLLENNRKAKQSNESPKVEGKAENEEDIVNLLKDICGSVNDLRSEITTADNFKNVEAKQIDHDHYKEKSWKLDTELANLKSKLVLTEERLAEEKRKNLDLEDSIAEHKSEIRQLNIYLKDADDFSKETARECHFLKQELMETKLHLKLESEQKEAMKNDTEKLKELCQDYKYKDTDQRVENVRREYEQKIELEIEKNKQLSADLRETKEKVRELEQTDAKVLPLELEGPIPTTSRSTLSSKSEMSQDKSYDELRESHRRLKQKTRQLLKQYRGKRSLLEKKERQLTLQRAGLVKLQTLHQSVETNHYVVIHHLGQQTVQIAKLVSTLWPESREVMEELYRQRENKLSDWILYIDNLSSWIVQKLVKISVKKRDVVKSSLETSLSTLEHNKTSICEAARNEDSQMFKNIQRELITGLEEEKTDADSSIGTWM